MLVKEIALIGFEVWFNVVTGGEESLRVKDNPDLLLQDTISYKVTIKNAGKLSIYLSIQTATGQLSVTQPYSFTRKQFLSKLTSGLATSLSCYLSRIRLED